MVQHRLFIPTFITTLLLVMGNHALASGCKGGKGKIARALVTTAIENREPVNRVLILENKYPEIYFFSDLRHMQGQKIMHRWEHEGKLVMTKTFEIKGPRWRIYSRKELLPDMLGQWTVVITDKDDCPLKAVVFQYVRESNQGSAIINLKNE